MSIEDLSQFKSILFFDLINMFALVSFFFLKQNVGKREEEAEKKKYMNNRKLLLKKKKKIQKERCI